MGETGFLVITPTKEAFTNVPILFVWIAYSAGEEWAEGLAYIEQLARAGGQKKITMQSSRRGWEQRGFIATYTEYERMI